MSFRSRGSSSATRTVCFLVIMGTFRTTRCSRNSWRVLDFCQKREAKAEGTPFAVTCALGPDAAPVRFDEALADRQSQTGATDASRCLGLDAMETIEDSIDLTRGDSKPLVGNRHDQLTPVCSRREADAATIRRILNGVGDQVLH